VVGSAPLPRGQVVSKMWEYIRLHNLQNPENRREILADDKLRRVFGKDKVTMLESATAQEQEMKRTRKKLNAVIKARVVVAAVGGTGRSPSWRVSSAFIRTGSTTGTESGGYLHAFLHCAPSAPKRPRRRRPATLCAARRPGLRDRSAEKPQARKPRPASANWFGSSTRR
jgi:hypothetical protein